MIEQKIEGMGWNYKIDPKPYQSQKIIDDITEFSTNIDKELGKPGCGFMLALFHFSLDDINRFQNEMGYFPFDSSIDIPNCFNTLLRISTFLSDLDIVDNLLR